MEYVQTSGKVFRFCEQEKWLMGEASRFYHLFQQWIRWDFEPPYQSGI